MWSRVVVLDLYFRKFVHSTCDESKAECKQAGIAVWFRVPNIYYVPNMHWALGKNIRHNSFPGGTLQPEERKRKMNR